MANFNGFPIKCILKVGWFIISHSEPSIVILRLLNSLRMHIHGWEYVQIPQFFFKATQNSTPSAVAIDITLTLESSRQRG